MIVKYDDMNVSNTNYVIKRDGIKVPFNTCKIATAILKAIQSVHAEEDGSDENIASRIEHLLIKENGTPFTVDVEHIQDLVEAELIHSGMSDVAKHYILYREERAKARAAKTQVNKTIAELIGMDSKDSDTKRENANIDGDSVCGSLLKIAGTVTKEFFLNNIKPKFKKMFTDGEIHLHDLDLGLFTVNCLYVPVGKLLKSGFSTGHGHLRTPATIGSAANLACIVIQANQNDMFGGQAIPFMDHELAPFVAKSYVRNIAEYYAAVNYGGDQFTKSYLKEHFVTPMDKYIAEHDRVINQEGHQQIVNLLAKIFAEAGEDITTDKGCMDLLKMFNYVHDKTDRDTYQAMEAMVHNFCSLQSRSGGQTPFSSVNFGTDITEEGRMISLNLLNAIDAGLGAGETAIFPIAVFSMMKGVNDKGSKNYDIYQRAIAVSARRAFPNFCNVSAPMNELYYQKGHPETMMATMGAVAHGKIKLTAIIANQVKTTTMDIADAFSWLESNNLVEEKDPIKFDANTIYHNVDKSVLIADAANGCHARVKKVMKFAAPDLKWKKLTYRVNGLAGTEVMMTFLGELTCTDDHPLVRYNNMKYERVLVRDMKPGDRLKPSFICQRDIYDNSNSTKIEVSVVSIEDVESDSIAYDFETDTDRFDIDYIVSHNCRTRVLGNVYDPTKQVTAGRGNLFFSTISLPYLALLAKEKYPDDETKRLEYFYELLDQHVDDLIEFSRDRFEMIGHRKAKNFPFLMGQHLYVGSENLHPDDEVREVLKQGSQTIGFLGLAECLIALVGKHHGESVEAQELGLNIVSRMRERIDRYAEGEHMNYSLMATPAEGCSGRLLRAAKKRFGIVPGVTDKAYFTNSMHVPVNYSISAYDKINIEAPYHPLCNAGVISYVELSYDATRNLSAFERLITYMADSGMCYFSINHPVDHDPVCGYVGYFPDGVCPRCGRKDGEGVSVRKLLSLTSYNPTPEYAIKMSDLEQEDAVPNIIEFDKE